MPGSGSAAQVRCSLGSAAWGFVATSAASSRFVINGLGRMEAKDLIERAPVDVLKRVPEAEARRGRELLEKGGAWVEIN